MNRIFIVSLLIGCSLVLSCDKLSPIYGTDVRVQFNPLKIYEIDVDKAELETTGTPKVMDGRRFYSLHMKGGVINAELASLEGSVKDYEGRTIGDATSAQKAYAHTVYPRVRDVKKSWVIEHNADVPARFCYMYVNGVPTITAKSDCFGLPAGNDLSKYFYLRQSGLIRRDVGFSINMFDGTDIPFCEFFCQDALIPIDIGLWSAEIVSDAPDIEITISLPVRVEYFWTYALRKETWGQEKEIAVEYSNVVIRCQIKF